MTPTSGAPLRVLLVVDTLDIGGAEQHVIDLARELQRHGHMVTIACSTVGARRLPMTDAPVARLPSAYGPDGSVPLSVLALLDHPVKRAVSLPYARALRRLLVSRRFDLVHAHLYASAVAAARASRGTSTLLVVTEHTEGTWQGLSAQRVARAYLRRAAQVVAVSAGIKHRLIEELGVEAAKVSVIPNAVPNHNRQSHVPPGPPRTGARLQIGVVARLLPEKGIDIFLDAAGRIAPLHPTVDMVIAGDGPCRLALEGQAAALGLAGRVAFLGAVPEARLHLGGFDGLVVPSRTEGTPLVVLEAQAAGIPVVATSVGGVPDQIRDGIDGILVPPENACALAGAMHRLLCDPFLRRRMAAAAQRRASSLAHTTMTARIEQIYASL